jgi:hypothetical protein
VRGVHDMMLRVCEHLTIEIYGLEILSSYPRIWTVHRMGMTGTLRTLDAPYLRPARDEDGNARARGEEHGGGDSGGASDAPCDNGRNVAARHLGGEGLRVKVQRSGCTVWGLGVQV